MALFGKSGHRLITVRTSPDSRQDITMLQHGVNAPHKPHPAAASAAYLSSWQSCPSRVNQVSEDKPVNRFEGGEVLGTTVTPE